MRILDIRSLDGPNIYHHQPVLVMRLDLEDVVETHSAMIPGYVDRLLDLVPEIRQHRCSPGYVGGFVERLRHGTFPAHVVEHVAIGLSERAGLGIGFGKARHSGEGSIYNVVIRFRSRRAMEHLLVGAVALVERAMRAEPVDAAALIEEVRRIALEEDPGDGWRAIRAHACARMIPVRLVRDGTSARLGYGRFTIDLDVATATVDDVDRRFSPGVDGRIPIVAVTGSVDTTATAVSIARALAGRGLRVGSATRLGICVGDERITRDDASGPDGARALLDDTRIDAAVLEVSWQGIVEGGLGYDWSRMAVITALSEEDLGAPCIEEIEDLANVVSVVAERVREGGTIVIDAGDDVLAELVEHERVTELERRIVRASQPMLAGVVEAAMDVAPSSDGAEEA